MRDKLLSEASVYAYISSYIYFRLSKDYINKDQKKRILRCIGIHHEPTTYMVKDLTLSDYARCHNRIRKIITKSKDFLHTKEYKQINKELYDISREFKKKSRMDNRFFSILKKNKITPLTYKDDTCIIFAEDFTVPSGLKVFRIVNNFIYLSLCKR